MFKEWTQPVPCRAGMWPGGNCALATFLGTATKHLAEGLKEGCFSSFGLQFQDTAHPNGKVWLQGRRHLAQCKLFVLS